MRMERMTIGALNRAWVLLCLCLCCFYSGSSGFTLGNTLGNIDLDTTLPLTTAAFWQFAHDRDFYRSTRQQTATVRQEVVDLSNWEQTDDPTFGTDNRPDSTVPSTAPPGVGSARPGRISRRLSPSEDRQQPQPQSQPQPQPPQQQQPQLAEQSQPRPRPWHRRARLNYAISSPFGSSDATVVQEHTLLEVEQHEEGGGGGGGTGICYSERDCITGFPMIPGDLLVKTTFLVTPADGNPERVRVRVGVVVEDVELPKRLQFLNKRVSKIIGNGGRKQAEKWLAEMITAESLAAKSAVGA